MTTPQDRAIEKSLLRVRNPLTAIRAFCVQCMGGYVQLIQTCPSVKCPLHAYRRGRNPYAKLRGKPFQIVKSSSLNAANSEGGGLNIDEQQAGEEAA
ncbi:MAG: hypothetical protein OEQ39_15125 [Gammaproteobacteria bacterium]|nr:hypothetical protein [Gammaproteobacteria bacterium]